MNELIKSNDCKITAIIAIMLVLFFFQPVTAQQNPFEISKQSIQIEISKEGNAKAMEKFFLKFASKEESRKFIEQAEFNGPSMEAWKNYDERIAPSLGAMEEISEAKIFFDSKNQFLSIEYQLNYQAASIEQETAGEIFFAFNKRIFNSFAKYGSIIIPQNTEITIILPTNSQIINKVIPEAKITKNQVSWKGYLSTNKLSLDYSIKKPLAQQINLSSIINYVLNTRQNLLFLIIAALAVIIVYWKKDKISKKIEDFVINNTSVEQAKPEEEIQIEE